ncbi:GrpB-like predicted nucleotidyltransferase (UPF0157 family) [Pseudomonas sp. 210_17 TE3656]
MALTSKITTYNPEWPQRFEADKVLLASAFGDELLAMHHVGSTAVPQLAAKPEIDVLIEVSEHRNEVARDEVLLNWGMYAAVTCRKDTISTAAMLARCAPTRSTFAGVVTIQSSRC